MGGLGKQRISLLLCLLMLLFPLTGVVGAGTAPWRGGYEVYSPIGGGNQTMIGWEIPADETILDAWLEVDEDGMTDLGTGMTWIADDQTGYNFSYGLWRNVTADFFGGSLSLDAHHAVGRLNDFETLAPTLQGWNMGGTPNVWVVSDLSGVTGPINGTGREASGGIVPLGAVDGNNLIATMDNQALPQGVHAWLESPGFAIPNVINGFNLTFHHWYHLHTYSASSGYGDGSWVEASLDGGASWVYLVPDGGYDNQIAHSAPVPSGASGSGFGVWASPNASRWQAASFNLDNLQGLNNASSIKFRFSVWTDPNSPVQRPGWFIDEVNLTNQGADLGTWFHGNLTSYYADGAESYLMFPVNLSNASGPIMLDYAVDFDMEGDIYDNFRWDWAVSNFTWNPFSPSMPGFGVLIGGQNYVDDSRGWKPLSHPLPQSLAGNSTVWVRLHVETDAFPGTGFGGSTLDPPEGVFIDNVRISSGVTGNMTEHLFLNFTDAHTPNLTHGAIGNAIDEWQHLTTHGVDGPSYQMESFEYAPLLPEGWSIETVRGSGWEFGEHDVNWTYGPDPPTSGTSYAGIVLGGKYQPDSWSHLISAEYDIPVGSHTRLKFDQFACSELAWDGGVVFVTENGGRTWAPLGQNEPDFYDTLQNMNPNSDIYNLWAMDGSNAKPSCIGQRGGTNNKSWVTKTVDVSQFAGKTIQFRFSFFTDPLYEEDGWYVDNVGIEIDWFESHGNWTSDPIYPEDLLGLDSIEFDAEVPNGTWVRASVLSYTENGSATYWARNKTLPLSLLGLEGSGLLDDDQPIRIIVEMGTNIPQLTPKIHAMYLGGVRVLNPFNINSGGWSLDSHLEINQSQGRILNPTLTAGYIDSSHVIPSHPITHLEIRGYGAGVLLTFRDEGGDVIHTGYMANGTVQTTSPFAAYDVEVALLPGGWIESLLVLGRLASPAVGASIDILDDGEVEWQWPGYTVFGGMGWNTQASMQPGELPRSSPGGSAPENGTSLRGGLISVADSTLIQIPRHIHCPTGAIPVRATFLDEMSNDIRPGDWLEFEVGQNMVGRFDYNRTSGLLVIDAADMAQGSWSTAQSVTMNQTLRDWHALEVMTKWWMTDSSSSYASIRLLAFEYTLTENVTGLAPTLISHVEASQSFNGTNSILVAFGSWQGGVGLNGGVSHAPLMVNSVASAPVTMVPDRSATISTTHTHLFDAEFIYSAELNLTLPDGTTFQAEVTSISDNYSFSVTTMRTGLGLNTDSSTVTRVANGWSVDWVIETDWNLDDLDWIQVRTQAVDFEGTRLTPGFTTIGGGAKAIENDMQIDAWEVRALDGRLLSTRGIPAYPFEVAAGMEVEVSGTVRFEDSMFRPNGSNFQVGVQVEGIGDIYQVSAEGSSDGTWYATVPLPAESGLANLTSWIVRPGPLGTSLIGAEDNTVDRTPVSIVVDPNPPQIGELMIHTPSGLRPADGNNWPESRPLPLSVEVFDSEALGGAIFLHYWREGIDDFDDDGYADIDEYIILRETTPMKQIGSARVDFRAIDLIGNGELGSISLYLTGSDLAGHPLDDGGGPGIDNDKATMVTQDDLPTSVSLPSMEFDSVDSRLMVGGHHRFTFAIHDGNGISSLDNFTLTLSNGNLSTELWFDPLTLELSCRDDSPITPLGVEIVELAAGSFEVIVRFRFTLDSPIKWDSEPQIPSLRVTEHGEVLPLGASSLEPLQWSLDRRMELVLINTSDLSPPFGPYDGETLYLQSGDRFNFEGRIQHRLDGRAVTLDGDWQVNMSMADGSVEPEWWLEPLAEGRTFTTMKSVERQRWQENRLTLSAWLEGPSTTEQVRVFSMDLTIDDIAPVIEFPTETLSTVQSNRMMQQLVTVRVLEEGGMGETPLSLHWSFIRYGADIVNMQGTSQLALGAESGGIWTYSGRVDFDVSQYDLRPGDQLLVWVEGADLAGHALEGHGSSTNPRLPYLRVIYFHPVLADLTVSPDTPIVDEKLTIDGMLENKGNDIGVAHLSLITWQGTEEEGRYVTLNQTNFTLMPQQHVLFTFELEAWQTGDLQLYLVLNSDLENLTSVPVPKVRTPSASESLITTLSSPAAMGLLLLLLGMVVMGVIAYSRKDKDSGYEEYFDDEIDASDEEEEGGYHLEEYYSSDEEE